MSQEAVAQKPLSGRRVAVTGATGFIGRCLVKMLVEEQGATVTALVRNRRRASWFRGLPVDIKKLNLADRDAVERAVAGCAAVFNLAHDFRGPAAQVTDQFQSLVEACISLQVGRFVHVSSIVVYDDWPRGILDETSPAGAPGGAYKNAKWQTEQILRARAGTMSFNIVQPTIVYGPHGWMWTDRLVEQLLAGEVRLPNDGTGLCPAVYVSDVAQALILAASAEVAGETFIISGAEPVPWRALYEGYAWALGRGRITSFHVDPAGPDSAVPHTPPADSAGRRATAAVAGRIQSVMGEDMVRVLRRLAARVRAMTGPVIYRPGGADLALYCSQGRCGIDKARRLLGYEPKVDFARGMELTAQYIRAKYR